MEKGAMERSMEVDLSAPAGQIKRMVHGRLQGGTPAVYVASLVEESSLITDVYAVLDGALTNVAAANSSDTGVQTIRNYYVYADDLDGDGVMELPALVNMIPITLEDADAGQKLIRWYAMSKNGEMTDKLYTYHDFTAGWYMEVDGEWAGRLTVAQQGSDYDFFLWDKNFRAHLYSFRANRTKQRADRCFWRICDSASHRQSHLCGYHEHSSKGIRDHGRNSYQPFPPDSSGLEQWRDLS